MKHVIPWLLFVLVQHGALPSLAVANDEALAVIVNPSTRASSISSDRLEAIFSLSEREWSAGVPVIPFNYAPGTSLREQFDQAILGMGPDEVARFWIDRRIRGFGDSPRKVPSVALMLRVIAKLPGAIGYVPESAVTSDVTGIARIKNGKVLPPLPGAGGTR